MKTRRNPARQNFTRQILMRQASNPSNDEALVYLWSESSYMPRSEIRAGLATICAYVVVALVAEPMAYAFGKSLMSLHAQSALFAMVLASLVLPFAPWHGHVVSIARILGVLRKRRVRWYRWH